jgi:hypothetical protein
MLRTRSGPQYFAQSNKWLAEYIAPVVAEGLSEGPLRLPSLAEVISAHDVIFAAVASLESTRVDDGNQHARKRARLKQLHGWTKAGVGSYVAIAIAIGIACDFLSLRDYCSPEAGFHTRNQKNNIKKQQQQHQATGERLQI